MDKFYLLRNNKQSGPYTPADAPQLNIIETDLIWVEGKSISWQHPAVVASIQNSVAEPSENKKAQNTALPQQPQSAPLSKHIFVSMPSGTSLEKDTQIESFEKKVQEAQERANLVDQPKENKKETIDTKYVRSLEEIKAEYRLWLQQKSKQTFKRNIKPIVATLIILTLVAGAFIFIKTSEPTTPVKTSIARNVAPQQQKELQVANKKIASKEEEPTVQNVAIKEKVRPVTPTVENNKSKTTAAKTTTQAARKSPATGAEEPTFSNAHTVQNNTTEETTPLTQQVQVSGKAQNAGGSFDTYQVTVHNKSKQVLKTVAVDVFYYKKDSKLAQKQTLYFSNVQPGAVATTKASPDEKAVRATCHLGLLTSEEGAIYFARQ